MSIVSSQSWKTLKQMDRKISLPHTQSNERKTVQYTLMRGHRRYVPLPALAFHSSVSNELEFRNLGKVPTNRLIAINRLYGILSANFIYLTIVCRNSLITCLCIQLYVCVCVYVCIQNSLGSKRVNGKPWTLPFECFICIFLCLPVLNNNYLPALHYFISSYT